jgi:ABC-type polysaccharide/polyol phosphate export permease
MIRQVIGWRYGREDWYLLRELTIAQFKLRDRNTFLGFLWSLLHPVLMAVILIAVFRDRLGSDVRHFELYVLVGMVHYTYFANATSASMRALLTMNQLTRDAVLPKELIVISSSLSFALEFVVSMMLCIAAAAVFGPGLDSGLWALGVSVVLQIVLVAAISLALAVTFPLVRDLDHLYQIFLRVFLFATPIFYQSDMVSSRLFEWWLAVNPVYSLIAMSRAALIAHESPSVQSILGLLLFDALGAFAALLWFKRLAPRAAEHV